MRNVFDYLSAEYKSKDDNYRFRIIKKIVNDNYDLQEVLKGYKIFYEVKLGKSYVLEAILYSLFYQITANKIVILFFWDNRQEPLTNP